MKKIYFPKAFFKSLFLFFSFFLMFAFWANANTYYLTAAGAASAQTPASWNIVAGGGGTAATNFTTNTDIFIIPSTINGIFGASTIFGSGASSGSGATIQVLGSMTINNGFTITLNGKGGNNSSITVTGSIIFGATSKVSLNDNDSRNSFVLLTGATLKTANVLGVVGPNCSVEKTVITNPTVTLTNGANYEFNGTAPQATLGLPTTAATINTLTINNAAGVNLSTAATVTNLNVGNNTLGSIFNDNGNQITGSGIFTLTSGTFNIGTTSIATQWPGFSSANSNISTGTTVNYNSTSLTAQIMAAVNYYNLSSVNGLRTLPTGTVGIAGVFTPGSGNYTVTVGNAVSFNGTSAQTIPAISPIATFTFFNLNINNPAGVSFNTNKDITVASTLFLTKGILSTGTYKLIINSPGFVSRPANGGWVYGNLQKPINASATSFSIDFEIGGVNTLTDYCPVTLDYSSTSAAGSLIATVTTSPVSHPAIASSGLDNTKTVTRYWTITKVGTFTGTYDATFNYNTGSVPGTANPNLFDIREYSSGAWVTPLPPTTNRTSNSTKANGFTLYGDFVVGQSTGTPTVATNPSATSSICEGVITSFTSSSSSIPAPSIQWQRSVDNGVIWADITGFTDGGGKYTNFSTSTLNIANATASMNGYLYRAKFANINGVGYSSISGGKLIVNVLPIITSMTYTSSTYSSASPAQSGPTFVASNYSGGTFSVSPAGLANFNTVTGAFTPVGSSINTYTVTYKITNGACAEVSKSATITISSAAISYSQASYCSNNTTSQSLIFSGFTENLSASITVSPVPAGANLNNTRGTFTPSSANPGIYTVTYTDGSVMLSTTVTVTQLPASTISYSPSNICNLDASQTQVTYSGTTGAYTGGFFSYTPSVSGNILNIVVSGGTPSNPLGNIIGTGSSVDNYNIVYTIPASGGCPAVATSPTSVTIVASPVATLTYGSGGYSICKSVASLSPVVTGLPAGGTFTQPSGQTGLSANGSGVIDPSGSTPGTYNMIYTVNSGTSCGDVSITSGNIVIVNNPSLAINYSSGNYCTGDAGIKIVTFTGTGFYNGATFSASPSGLSINSNSGSITPSTSTGAAGSPYLVTASIPNCNLATPITTYVEIDPSPTATISYAATSFCELDGTQHAVSITGTTGGTFSYTSSPLGLNLNIDQPTGGTITPIGSNPGTYTILYTISNGSCSTSATTPVTITPVVGATTLGVASGSTQPTCQITASTPTTTYTATALNKSGFNWSITPAGAGSISLAGVVTWTVGFSGAATISVQAQGCGGSTSSANTTVTINPTVGTPTAITIDAGADPTCQITATTPTTTYGTTATNSTGLNWSLSNSAAGSINSSGVMTWTNGFTGAVDIRVTASGCNGPSSPLVIHSVNITPAVGTPSTPTPSAATICQASTATTYTTSATNATGYIWSVTGAGNTISGTGVSAIVTWNPAFTGSATVGVQASGCNGNSSVISTNVSVTSTVTINAFSPATSSRCQGVATVTITTTATNSTGITYSLDATTAAFSGNSINPSTGAVTYAAGWSGTTTITASAAGCNGPATTTHVATVNALTVAGTLSPSNSTPLTVCSSVSGPGSVLTLSGNNGTVSHWETSINAGVSWANIGNANSTTFNYSSITTTTLYRVFVTNGTCTGAYSALGQIVVLPPFTAVITPSATATCIGVPITLTASGYSSTGQVIAGGDFPNPSPAGWTGNSGNASNNSTGNPVNATWGVTNNTGSYNGVTYFSSTDKFMIVNGAVSSALVTPVFSTVGMSSAVLAFNEGYNFSAGTAATIEISTSGVGGPWTILKNYTVPAVATTTNPLGFAAGINLNTYLGLSNLAIRFNYVGTALSNWALDNVVVTNTISNPSGTNVYNPLTYTWSPATYLSSQSTNPTTVTPTAAGSISYTVSTSAGGCPSSTISAAVLVTFNPNPIISAMTANPCSETVFTVTPVNVTNGTVPTGTTYGWGLPTVTGAITGGAIGSGAASITGTLTNPTSTDQTATYTVTPLSGTCTGATFTVTVTVKPKPTLSSGLSATARCNNISSTYTATSATAGTTFSWTRALVTGISNIAGSGSSATITETLVNTTAAPVTVTYVVSLTANGCSNSQNVTVIINPTPTLSSSLTPPARCSNVSTTYTATTATASTSYSWTRAFVAGISNLAGSGSGAGITETLVNTTPAPVDVIYIITLTANSCSNTQNVTVTVNPSPTLSSIIPIPARCSNVSTTYTATSATSGATFSWTRAVVAGISNILGSGSSATLTETLVNTTAAPVTVTYAITVAANGCNNTQNVTVIVNPTPTLSSTLTPPARCSNVATTYTSTSATAGATFSWTRATVTGISNSAGSGSSDAITETLVNTTAAPVTVTYVVTIAANGCSNSQNVTVVINPSPTLSSSLTPPARCSNVSTTYTATTATASTSFSWTRAAVAGISNIAGSGSSATITETLVNTTSAPVDVIYIITLTSNSCSNTQNVTITINPTPTLSSSLTAASCSGSSVGYTAISATSGSTFSWTRAVVSGISELASSGTSAAITEVLTNTTSLPVNVTYVIITSANGCSNSPGQNVLVTVRPSNTWLGVNTNWNDPLNWCPTVPTLTTNVTIPVVPSTIYPVIGAGTTALVGNITIANSAFVTVNGNTGTLQIAGAITNNGTFDVSAGTLEFKGSSAQSFSGNLFVGNTLKNLTVSNTDLTVSGAGTPLNITGELAFGAVSGADFKTGDNIVLVSTATGTARVADITNDGARSGNKFTGKVTVERYYPARRSWRVATSPLSNTGSIFSNWQESVPSTYVPGRGTFITGPTPNTLTNGLDASFQNHYSIKGWRASDGTYINIGNTLTTNLSSAASNAANIGYYLFVRGDRSRSPDNTVIPNTNETTLSSKGNLQTGNQTFGVESTPGTYTLIGNPFASSIDFTKITKVNINPNRFYVYDPNLGTIGGFVAMEDFSNSGLFTPTPFSKQGNFIQSSQAFFVQNDGLGGPASITVKEDNKSNDYNKDLFRPSTPLSEIASLRTNLLQLNSNSSNLMVDGFLVAFDNNFHTEVDIQDAMKFTNINENLGLKRDGKILCVERRPLITADDTLFIQISKTTQRRYRLAVEPANLDPLLTAFLEDSYTGTKNILSVTSNTDYDFEINGDAASSATNRFRIVFKKLETGPLPVTYKDINAYQQQANIAVEWTVENELNMSKYEVERSTNGINYLKVNTSMAVGSGRNSTLYKWLDVNPVYGNNYYRIRGISLDGKYDYSKAVVVKISKGIAGIAVYPNPVVNGTIGLAFSNMPGGIYKVSLFNSIGQTILNKQINHAIGTSLENIRPNYRLVSGIYKLEITTPDNTTTTIKLLVK